MHAFTIDNPEMERLAKEVFSNEPISTSAEFYHFLLEQKVKQDLQKSLEQLEVGNVNSEDETFRKLYAELGL